MMRVSSRQRLVSWDDFDAAAYSSDTDLEEDFLPCYKDSLSQGSSFALGGTLPLVLDSSIQPIDRDRKRDREEGASKKLVVPPILCDGADDNLNDDSNDDVKRLATLITAIPTEMTKSLTEKWSGVLPFGSLIDDVKLHVLSFLSVSEAGEMGLVSKQSRRLLHSQEAMTLWAELSQRRWPSMPKVGVEFVDLLRLPPALVGSTRQDDPRPNMSVLLGMAARHHPTKIDEPQLASLHRRHSRNMEEMPQRMFRTLEVSDGRSTTQYLGPIGIGNRCIRADQPLAGPERLGRQSSSCVKASLFDFLCRGNHAVETSSPPWRPFVAPYVTTTGEKTQVNLTPRLVSYYEVSLLPCPEDSLLVRSATSSVAECVAIGIATESFHLHSRLPGWDGHSYGYHGDDGGIFHGSGTLSKQFGPFGQGDTVGCGVNYITGGIFFTLNGRFLGYGWTNVGMDFLEQQLYPTIGVDSNLSIECNFGERPFAFDITSIMQQQRDIVKECWTSTRATNVQASFPTADRKLMS